MSPDFRTLWAAVGISHFGTLLGALTLTALLYLDARPSQMGILIAAATAPAFLVGLHAGVWVDRTPQRRLLVLADLGRFAVLITVPAAALFDTLTLEQLYLVAFIEGCLEVVFNLAYRSILPSLVAPDELVSANARLRMMESVAESAGPTAGGGLVQFSGAPVAVLVDALSFLFSASLLSRLAVQPPQEPAPRTHAWREAMAGVRATLNDRRLRALLGMSCTYGFFGSFLITLFAFRVLTELGLSPLALGLIALGGGMGSFIGAAIAAPLVRMVGIGPAIVLAYLLAVSADATVPLAGGPRWFAFAVLFAGQLVGNVFYVAENVASLSLRQAVTPGSQLGRVNATFLVANRSLRPAGALAAGLTAEVFGVQEALILGVAGMFAGWFWLILSPLSATRKEFDARA